MKNDGRNLIQNDHHGQLWFNPERKGVLVGQNQQNQCIVHKSLKQIIYTDYTDVYRYNAFKTELQRNHTAKIDMAETETALNSFGRAEYRA